MILDLVITPPASTVYLCSAGTDPANPRIIYINVTPPKGLTTCQTYENVDSFCVLSDGTISTDITNPPAV